MSSGVAVDDQCLEVFQDLKLKRKYKYIIYKLNADNSCIVVEKTAESATYDEFIAALPKGECRYAIFDFDYEKPGEGQRHKICFVAWSPDTAKIKAKMLFASSKDALRKKLVGVATEIQGTDLSEVAYDTVLDKVSKSITNYQTSQTVNDMKCIISIESTQSPTTNPSANTNKTAYIMEVSDLKVIQDAIAKMERTLQESAGKRVI